MYNLNNTCQKHREDLVTFVKHCRDLALDCYDQEDEEALMEICINNIIPDYMIYLENNCSAQFLRLLEAVGKTSIYDNKVFTIEMSKEYNSMTLEIQQINQEITAVTLHNLFDMEIDAVERYLSQGQRPITTQVL
ncbi:hypothetical protein C1H46_012495 [Malus baccata]|uniref:Uncharacterized protein n=1 Tax=Malus baccata TaxID=106549 RepID=A0A540MSY6_MALBA|nr:hypothetical protein C1H46_012495 [Malus baccata]